MHASVLFSRMIPVVCALGVIGCMDSVGTISNLVPVTGSVAFDGKPLPHGTILFDPDGGDGQPAVGKIVNGEFTMVTTVSAPGVVKGKYRVRVESTEPFTPPPNAVPPFPEAKSLIPKKYNDLKTSGLTVEVEDGMVPVVFDLDP